MTKKIIKKITVVCLSLAFIFTLASQTLAAYDFATNSGLDKTAENNYITGAAASTIQDIVGTIIYVILGLVGVIFMGLIIYGAMIWMTAQGNDEKVKKAMKILFAALFGLMITLAAYVLTYFLITYFWK